MLSTLFVLHTRSHMEWIGAYGGISYPDFLDYQKQTTSYQNLAGAYCGPTWYRRSRRSRRDTTRGEAAQPAGPTDQPRRGR